MTVAIGIDIGQAVDPTAIIVVESYLPEPERTEDRPEIQHQIRWIEKVPLGTSYLQVVERITVVAERCVFIGHPTMVVDATGVGRPVVDMLRKRSKASLRAVTFTGGDKEKKSDAYSSRVPKRDLVTALEVVLQSRRLHVVPDCPLQEDLAAELQSFEVNLNARGHDTYDGASGKHDDLVSALMLALWYAERHGGMGWGEMYRRLAARQ
jgi:hypothetical protein